MPRKKLTQEEISATYKQLMKRLEDVRAKAEATLYFPMLENVDELKLMDCTTLTNMVNEELDITNEITIIHDESVEQLPERTKEQTNLLDETHSNIETLNNIIVKNLLALRRKGCGIKEIF